MLHRYSKCLFVILTVFSVSLYAQNKTDESKYLVGFDEKKCIQSAKAEGVSDANMDKFIEWAKARYIQTQKNKEYNITHPFKAPSPASTHNANCQNLDYEDGNYTNWVGASFINTNAFDDWGTVNYVWTPGFVTAGSDASVYNSNARHTFMTIQPGNNDYAAGKLVGWDSLAMPVGSTKSEVQFIPPGAGKYTVRLGTASIVVPNAYMQNMSYNFSVTNANKLFTYKYAIFLNERDPSNAHPKNEQPFFSLVITKPNGDTIKDATGNCGYYVVDASTVSTDPTFIKSRWKTGGNSPGNIYYRKWTTESVDLSAYNGQTLKIEFKAAHCSAAGHFGYVYLDADCGEIKLTQQNICIGNSAINLIAPPGYHDYQWQGPNNTVNIPAPNGTNDTLHVANPQVGDLYTVVMYNASNCLTTATIKVDTATIKLGLTTTPSCNSGKTGSASAVSIGSQPFPTNPPYNFSWTTGPNGTGTVLSTTQTANNLGAGTYYLRITSPNCPNKDTFVVIKQLPAVLKKDSVTFCKTTGIIPAPLGNTNYQWYDAGGVLIPGAAGTNDTLFKNPVSDGQIYTVTLINFSGCKDSIQYKLKLFDANFKDSTYKTCFAGHTGGIILTDLTPVYAPYSYTWTGPPSGSSIKDTANPTIINLPVGTYVVNVTSTIKPSCTYTTTLTIKANPVPVKNKPGIFCLTHALLVADPTGTNYQWFDPSGTAIPPGSGITGGTNDSLDINTAANGQVYTVTFNDVVTGCKDSIRFTLQQFQAAGFDTLVNKTCYPGKTGSIVLTDQSFGLAPYTYSWTGTTSSPAPITTNPPPPNTVITIPALGIGTYSVTVTSTVNASCVYTQNFTVKYKPVPFKKDSVFFCHSTAIIPVATTGSAYQWYNNSGTAISGPIGTNDTLIYSPASNGQQYTVEYIDAAGCKDSIRFKIKLRNADFTPSTINTCAGGKTGTIKFTDNQTVYSPYNYTWTGTGPNSSSGQSTSPSANPVITPVGAGTYTVIITSNAQKTCNDTLTVQVKEDPIVVKKDTVFFCKTTGIIPAPYVSGATNYQWYTAAGVAINTAAGHNDTLFYTPVKDGETYPVTFYLASGCRDSVRHFMKLRDADLTPITINTCAGGKTGTIKFTDNQPIYAPYNYTWSGPGSSSGGPIGPSANPEIKLVGAGTYTVIITSNAQKTCMDTIKVTVKEDPIIVKKDSVFFCKSTAVIKTVTTGTNYQWYDNTGKPIPAPQGTGNTLTYSPAVNGQIYTVTYYNTAGCRDSIIYKIKLKNAKFTLQIDSPCYGGSTGKITLTNLVAGYNPFNYIWSGPTNPNGSGGPMTNPEISPVSAGVYNITVTSQTNTYCTFDTSITVKSLAPPPLITDKDTICQGGSSTLIANLPPNMPGPLKHHWYSQQIQPAGSPMVDMQVTTPGFVVSPTVGGNGYNVEGVYYIDSVRTVDGCKYAYRTQIIYNYINLSSTTPVIVNEPCWHDSVGSVTAVVQSTLAPTGQPLTFTWTGAFHPNQTNPVIHTSPNPPAFPYSHAITGLHPGTYTLTVTSNGCEKKITATVTEPPKPKPILSMEAWFCKRDTLGVLLAPAGYTSYLWYKIEPNGDTVFFAGPYNTNSLQIVTPEVAYQQYYVTYIYSNGCRMTTNAFSLHTPPPRFIPDYLVNVFSPNNDGKNERFTPFWDNLKTQADINFNADEYNLKIYDRWGHLVHESSKYLPGWDGKWDGKELSDGTYFWVATYLPQCGNAGDVITKKGYVHLMK